MTNKDDTADGAVTKGTPRPRVERSQWQNDLQVQCTGEDGMEFGIGSYYTYRRFSCAYAVTAEEIQGTEFRPDLNRVRFVGATGFIWKEGVNIATCKSSGERPHKDGAAVPVEECTCGFYGFHTFDPARTGVDEWVGLDTVCEFTGRLLIGTHGVRAQKARIIAITPTLRAAERFRGHESALSGLAARYDATLFMPGTGPNMFDEFPLTGPPK